MASDIISHDFHSVKLRYLAEGAANVVFELSDDSDRPHPDFSGMLLRLPKDRPNKFSYEDMQAFWKKEIKPLFGKDDLVKQELVRLPRGTEAVTFFDHVDAQLQQLDTTNGRSQKKFHGQTIKRVDYGMLVEDMRPPEDPSKLPSNKVNGSSVSARQVGGFKELKAKWLTQSPSAPPGSTRCRNCARYAAQHSGEEHPAPFFCPLNLLKARDEFSVENDLNHTVQRTSVADQSTLTSEEPGTSLEFSLYELCSEEAPHNIPRDDIRLRTWLRSNNVLHRLRHLQALADVTGTFNAAQDPDKFALAMTLRDCSLFLMLPDDDERLPTVAKLGDMDKKKFETKVEHWTEVERDLVDNGWYQGREPELTNCALGFYLESKSDFKVRKLHFDQ